jgi:hypothetical protein
VEQDILQQMIDPYPGFQPQPGETVWLFNQADYLMKRTVAAEPNGKKLRADLILLERLGTPTESNRPEVCDKSLCGRTPEDAGLKLLQYLECEMQNHLHQIEQIEERIKKVRDRMNPAASQGSEEV